MTEYITTGEAARMMGVTRESIRRYSDAGLLRSIRTPGGQRRIDRASVDRIVNTRQRVAPNVTILGGE